MQSCTLKHSRSAAVLGAARCINQRFFRLLSSTFASWAAKAALESLPFGLVWRGQAAASMHAHHHTFGVTQHFLSFRSCGLLMRHRLQFQHAKTITAADSEPVRGPELRRTCLGEADGYELQSHITQHDGDQEGDR